MSDIKLLHPLNIEMLRDRFQEIEDSVLLMKELQEKPKGEFVQKNSLIKAATENYLRRSLQALLDIAAHLLSRISSVKPSYAREDMYQLGKCGVIDKDFVETAQNMAGYRNRIVHHYLEIDGEELYKIICDELDDIQTLKKFLSRFVEKHEHDKDFLLV
ncbi:DUF86 domain-containing protein [Patescibacteria group bacterium]|nr:DUF86 domain-containing protein [Patescibacteria group bacterium]